MKSWKSAFIPCFFIHIDLKEKKIHQQKVRSLLESTWIGWVTLYLSKHMRVRLRMVIMVGLVSVMAYFMPATRNWEEWHRSEHLFEICMSWQPHLITCLGDWWLEWFEQLYLNIFCLNDFELWKVLNYVFISKGVKQSYSCSCHGFA